MPPRERIDSPPSSDDDNGAGEEGTLLLPPEIENTILADGFAMMPVRILRAPDLSYGAKTLYALLLSYAWYGRRCFPGMQRLGEEMNCSHPTLRKMMRELEALSLLRVKRRGLGKTNIYTLGVKFMSKNEHQE